MKSQQQPTTIQKTGSSAVSSPMTDEMEIALHPMYPADIMSDATAAHYATADRVHRHRVKMREESAVWWARHHYNMSPQHI